MPKYGYATRPPQFRGQPGESQWSRDITIPGNGQAEFIAPYDSDFWFVNQNTSAVTLQKGGHTALTLAAQAVIKDYVTQGDGVSIVGTAGLTISVYDTYDTKPIPTGKDILGKFNLADSTGANIASVDAAGDLQVDINNTPAVTVPLNPTVEMQGRKGGDAGALGTPSVDNTSVAGFTLLYTEPLSLVNPGTGWASSNDNTTNLGGKMPTLPATATSSTPSNTATNMVPLYEDLSGNLLVKLTSPLIWNQGNLLTEAESQAPLNVAAATAETTAVTGTTTLVVGQPVSWSLSMTGALATAADTLTYVALKGATSARYLAICGPGNSVAGTLFMASAEKINIVYRNQDSVAHGVAANWNAMTHT